MSLGYCRNSTLPCLLPCSPLWWSWILALWNWEPWDWVLSFISCLGITRHGSFHSDSQKFYQQPTAITVMVIFTVLGQYFFDLSLLGLEPALDPPFRRYRGRYWNTDWNWSHEVRLLRWCTKWEKNDKLSPHQPSSLVFILSVSSLSGQPCLGQPDRVKTRTSFSTWTLTSSLFPRLVNACTVFTVYWARTMVSWFKIPVSHRQQTFGLEISVCPWSCVTPTRFHFCRIET